MAKHLGDGGSTTNYKGERIAKDHSIIRACGRFDALLSALDIAMLHLPRQTAKKKTAGKTPPFAQMLRTVQDKLWQSAGEISLGSVGKNITTHVTAADTAQLESWMDTFAPLPKRFVRFTTAPSVYLNDARVRCRELEVEVTPLLRGKQVRPELYAYINRLSLFLFHLAYHLETMVIKNKR